MGEAGVMQAYRFALDPTPTQARELERHAGAARFAFNWALAAVRANLAQREAERSYGLDGDRLTPSLGWTLPALRRAWNQAKHHAAPWWPACSKEAVARSGWETQNGRGADQKTKPGLAGGCEASTPHRLTG